MPSVRSIAREIAIIGPQIGRRVLAELSQAVDLPHAQMFLLMRLFHQGPARSSEICRDMKVSAPTATGIISRLERAGLAVRSMGQKDRRVVVVTLTPEGRRTALKLRGVLVRRWTRMLARLTREDALKYLEILKKMSETL